MNIQAKLDRLGWNTVMIDKWHTRMQDMFIAREIIAEHGGDETMLGIFEMEIDSIGNVEKVRLSEWMTTLIKHFRNLYGFEQGDFVIKKIIGQCVVNGQTIH